MSHSPRPGVELVGAVERDRGDRIVDLVEDLLEGIGHSRVVAGPGVDRRSELRSWRLRHSGPHRLRGVEVAERSVSGPGVVVLRVVDTDPWVWSSGLWCRHAARTDRFAREESEVPALTTSSAPGGPSRGDHGCRLRRRCGLVTAVGFNVVARVNLGGFRSNSLAGRPAMRIPDRTPPSSGNGAQAAQFVHTSAPSGRHFLLRGPGIRPRRRDGRNNVLVATGTSHHRSTRGQGAGRGVSATTRGNPTIATSGCSQWAMASTVAVPPRVHSRCVAPADDHSITS